MIPLVVEVQTPGTHVKVERGHLVIGRSKDSVDKVPLDDVGIMLLSNTAVTLSAVAISRLIERGAQIIVCGANYFPVGAVKPFAASTICSERLELQLATTVPQKKNLWREMVKCKILNQAAVLEITGTNPKALQSLVGKVRSGDTSNVEAQAARIYWSLLFGNEFRRQRLSDGGVNVLLNYGYTVLRAAVARGIVATGLSPIVSLHHSPKANSFALVDDLMEPFRPLVDLFVWRLKEGGIDFICSEAKRELCSVLTFDVRICNEVSPLSIALVRFCRDYIDSLETKRAKIPRYDLFAEDCECGDVVLNN